MIHATDRELLIAATTAARQRMRDLDRDSWPTAERNDEPEHVSTILARLLDIYALRGLDLRRTVA